MLQIKSYFETKKDGVVIIGHIVYISWSSKRSIAKCALNRRVLKMGKFCAEPG